MRGRGSSAVEAHRGLGDRRKPSCRSHMAEVVAGLIPPRIRLDDRRGTGSLPRLPTRVVRGADAMLGLDVEIANRVPRDAQPALISSIACDRFVTRPRWR